MPKLTVLASYNMSWIHEDQLMLAQTQGIQFWSWKSFWPMQEHVGQTILELTEKAMAPNL